MINSVVPGFDAIIDQERPIRILTSFLTHGTIPHALLFTGIEGVGKRTAAIAFAMACNCTGNGGEKLAASQEPRAAVEPCGKCAACRKIVSGNHADVLRVAPAGLQIKIDQIRELCQCLAMKHHEARVRFALIVDAHRLNPSAGNALLKMLEEPPARTVLILTAPQKADLLPTIVSRCQHLSFKPIARHHLAAILHKAYRLSPDEAAATADLADGSVTRALAMHRGRWVQRRNWLMAELAGLGRQSTSVLLALAERLSREKTDLFEYLDLMAAWVRDVAVARCAPERIIHRDLHAQLVALSETIPERICLQAAETILEARRRIHANANPRLACEGLLLNMAASLRQAA